MPAASRVYVGNLPLDIRTRELEDLFHKYGRILDIDLKLPTRTPAYAFVDFEDARDAQDAVRGRNGYELAGRILRVEFANATRRGAPGVATAPKRNERGASPYAIEVSHLPLRMSWQELKDAMRRAGDVTFVDVDGRGGGHVEFSNKSDMQYAIDKLDDTPVRSDGEKTYMRIRLARKPSRSRSRDKSSRARSHSPAKKRSVSPRGRSRSPAKKRSVSRSPRGRSRSPAKKRSVSRSPRGRSRSPAKKRSVSRSPRRRSRSPGKKRRHDDDDGRRSHSRSRSASKSRSRSRSVSQSRDKKPRARSGSGDSSDGGRGSDRRER